ncbi:hypothetical protein FGB62_118g017 [Gracilaria domingensis]|nr:hypothetical protein FGB62_118g017 [Gracilaria domingensis]
MILLSVCTYAIELTLEFSTDSLVKDISKPEVLDIVVNNQGTCGFSEISETLVAEYLARIGDNCVAFSEKDQMYILYAPVWTRQGEAIFPRCVRTEDNELAREPGLYTNQNLDMVGSSFIDGLKRNSYGSNGDENQSVITIVGKNTDIVAIRRHNYQNQTFNTGPLIIGIPNTKISCMGNVFGRLGEGQMKAELTLCLDGEWPYNNSTDFLYLFGSAWIPRDSEFMTENWEVKIASTHGREIRDFGEGIVSDDLLSHTAFATFLGQSSNRDDQSIQRYALVYKYCELLQVPGPNSVWRRELVPRAKSVRIVRIQIEVWAVILVLCWPFFLCLLVLLTRSFIRKEEVPQFVLGEEEIGRHWSNCIRQSRKKLMREDDMQIDEVNKSCGPWPNIFGREKSNCLFLSVDPGEIEDDVTITSVPNHISRSRKKPFASIVTNTVVT